MCWSASARVGLDAVHTRPLAVEHPDVHPLDLEGGGGGLGDGAEDAGEVTVFDDRAPRHRARTLPKSAVPASMLALLPDPAVSAGRTTQDVRGQERPVLRRTASLQRIQALTPRPAAPYCAPDRSASGPDHALHALPAALRRLPRPREHGPVPERAAQVGAPPARARARLDDGRSVVVDNTNPTAEVRAPLIAAAVSRGAQVIGYSVEATPGEALARNRMREGKARVPDVAILSTARRLQRPRRSEGSPGSTEPARAKTGRFRSPRSPADSRSGPRAYAWRVPLAGVMHTEPIEGEAARRVSLLGGSHEDVVACGDEIPIGVETLRDGELSCDMREERQRGDQLRHVDGRAHDVGETMSLPCLLRDGRRDRQQP